MSESKPVVYVLHGDDPFAIRRVLDTMLAKMGDPGMAELNFSRLDGRELQRRGHPQRRECHAISF